MLEYKEKDQQAMTYTASNAVTQRKKNGGARGFSLVDNRQSSAQMQAKMPEMSGSKSEGQVLQAKGFNKVRQFKAEEPVQKQANRTGLPEDLKAGVENLSGLAMDDVRVHYNSDQPAQLEAHAYTQGKNIHLGPGQEKHLPHEAWHVVQQKEGRVRPTNSPQARVRINAETGLEKEADRNGIEATRMGLASGQTKRPWTPVFEGSRSSDHSLESISLEHQVAARAKQQERQREPARNDHLVDSARERSGGAQGTVQFVNGKGVTKTITKAKATQAGRRTLRNTPARVERRAEDTYGPRNGRATRNQAKRAAMLEEEIKRADGGTVSDWFGMPSKPRVGPKGEKLYKGGREGLSFSQDTVEALYGALRQRRGINGRIEYFVNGAWYARMGASLVGEDYLSIDHIVPWSELAVALDPVIMEYEGHKWSVVLMSTARAEYNRLENLRVIPMSQNASKSGTKATDAGADPTALVS